MVTMNDLCMHSDADFPEVCMRERWAETTHGNCPT